MVTVTSRAAPKSMGRHQVQRSDLFRPSACPVVALSPNGKRKEYESIEAAARVTDGSRTATTSPELASKVSPATRKRTRYFPVSKICVGSFSPFPADPIQPLCWCWLRDGPKHLEKAVDAAPSFLP